MRRSILTLLLALPGLRAGAQATTAGSATPASSVSQPATPSPAAAGVALPDSSARHIQLARQDASAPRFPAPDSFVVGNRTVALTERVPGSIAVVRGNLDVYGVVDGDAIAVDGDVVVHKGGRVHGNAFAAFGQVKLDGGYVQGTSRTLHGNVLTLPPRVSRPAAPVSGWSATRAALSLAIGWLAVLLGMGIAVFMFASGYLETVAETLERRFGRAFWTGILGQLGILPAFLVLVVGLALTIIGALLIPFAIVAFALAVAGTVALGFLAVAQITGRSVLRSGLDALSARGAALKALMTGIVVFLALWIVAALFAWAPLVMLVLRGLALALTWVAATAGFGAVLLSRAGTRRMEVTAERPVAPAPVPSWQTPTPITGVVAARRPTPAPAASGDVPR